MVQNGHLMVQNGLPLVQNGVFMVFSGVSKVSLLDSGIFREILKNSIFSMKKGPLDSLKGLSRIQPRAARMMEAASREQSIEFERQVTSTIHLIAAMMMTRAAARLSDIRGWIGGAGLLKIEDLSLSLVLDRRKTDQGASAPMAHVIGPIEITKEMRDRIQGQKEILTRDPLKEEEKKDYCRE